MGDGHKTADSLARSMQVSAANRAAMVARFGFVPKSVIREISRGALSKQMFIYQEETPARRAAGDPKFQAKRELVAAVTGRRRSASAKWIGRDHPGTSIMPAELVDFFIKYYARPGQTYLDPFMGQGVQMQVAKRRGMHYRGYDLSTEFCAYIEKVRARLDDGATVLQCVCGDSRDPALVPDGCGDFSFHSPPYWDIEFYGTEAGQLGYQRTYEEFLTGMEQVARAWLPKFKPGAWHCVNVNDFRKGKQFYSYHADTIALFRRAGWTLHDTWLIEGLVGGLSKSFAVAFNMRRVAPKVHEYVLVFRK